MEAVNSISDLKNIIGTNSTSVIQVLGYYTPGDGGGGLFYWDTNSTEEDDGGIIIETSLTVLSGRWTRSFTGAVNVKWFGAKGNGVTDDTNALQKAIDSDISVYLPEGLFLISFGLNISKSIDFYGAGKNSVIFTNLNSFSLLFISSDNIKIYNLSFVGGADNENSSQFAIVTDTSGVKNLKICNCYFGLSLSGKSLNNGIKIDDNTTDVKITDNFFENLIGIVSGTGYGVLCGDVSHIIVSNNTFSASEGRGRHGVYLSAGSSNSIVSNNFIKDFSLAGITVYSQGAQPYCKDILINGNYVENCSIGSVSDDGAISIFARCENITISNNIVLNSGANGVSINGISAYPIYNFSIKNNTIKNSGRIGIDIIATSKVDIVGNTIIESSLIEPGVHSNIRLASSGYEISNFLISGNRSEGHLYSRSPFQINQTVPLPENINIKGNLFENGVLTGSEINNAVVIVDGKISKIIPYTFPELSDLTSHSINFTVESATINDAVSIGFNKNIDGCQLSGYILNDNEVIITLSNLSGGTKSIPSGNLNITIIKQ